MAVAPHCRKRRKHGGVSWRVAAAPSPTQDGVFVMPAVKPSCSNGCWRFRSYRNPLDALLEVVEQSH